MWDASDEGLLAGFATGDPGAALVFVRRFQARVYGLAASITRDPDLAELVAQDTFVRAWRYAASFDPRRGSVVAWLLGITRNAALDQIRITRTDRDRAVVQPPESAVFDLIEPGESVPEALVELRDEVTQVTRALGDLPVPQRQALLAVTVGGRTAHEHAVDAGIPLGTAKTRIRLGLRRLRDRLEAPAR